MIMGSFQEVWEPTVLLFEEKAANILTIVAGKKVKELIVLVMEQED